MNASRGRTALTIAVASIAASTAAAAPLLPLDAGTYVVSTYSPCRDAPLAGVVAFDGNAFSGPHESDCRSVVVRRDGPSYRVRTTCRAAGDGTPATPSQVVTDVEVQSRKTFVLTHDGRVAEYRLCPAFR